MNNLNQDRPHANTVFETHERRWRNSIRLKIGLLILASAILYVFNAFEFPDEYIEFRAPNGSRDRMSLRPEALTSDESLAEISSMGVYTSIDKSICHDKAIRPRQLTRQIESELELRSIIDSLVMRQKPRQLTDAQKKIIERVPLCEPFLDELKVISRLLNGYDLISRR